MRAVAYVALAVLAAGYADAHGAITSAVGIDGQEGRALGIDPTTPRDGTKRTPFQRDTSIIRDSEVASGKSGPCGRTIHSGDNSMEAGVAAIMSEMGGLPQVAPGQDFKMTLHQINADGAGPYSCDVSADGSGKDFKKLSVSQNVPGALGLSIGGGKSDHPLTVTMPQDLQCSGGDAGNMCMVRCRNQAVAGPFGGCVPVQMGTAAAGGAAGGATGGAATDGAATGGAAGGATGGATGAGGGNGTGGEAATGKKTAAKKTAAAKKSTAAAETGETKKGGAGGLLGGLGGLIGGLPGGGAAAGAADAVGGVPDAVGGLLGGKAAGGLLGGILKA